MNDGDETLNVINRRFGLQRDSRIYFVGGYNGLKLFQTAPTLIFFMVPFTRERSVKFD